MHTWEQTVKEKINKLNSLSHWASTTNFARVRDYCRLAIAELEHELKRLQELKNGKLN